MGRYGDGCDKERYQIVLMEGMRLKETGYLKKVEKVLKGKEMGNKEATYPIPRHCEMWDMEI